MLFPLKGQRVLVVVAYPGDIVIGCGGSIASWSGSGAEIYLLEMSKSKDLKATIEHLSKMTDCTKNAARLLGIKEVEYGKIDRANGIEKTKETITNAINKYEPDLIITHHKTETDMNRKRVHNAVMDIRHQERSIGGVISFTPLEWNPESVFRPNLFMDITSAVKAKESAIACYGDNNGLISYDTARYWGSLNGLNFAEAFEIVYLIS
jgi:LmbE family N-acetylglucosaminyl deacetylase